MRLPLRVRLAYHVLRGRQLLYGATFTGPVQVEIGPHMTIANCTVRGHGFTLLRRSCGERLGACVCERPMGHLDAHECEPACGARWLDGEPVV